MGPPPSRAEQRLRSWRPSRMEASRGWNRLPVLPLVHRLMRHLEARTSQVSMLMAEFSAMRILVVCAGNICRSPLAEALLRRALSERGVQAEITSAGLSAEPGLPPSEGLDAPARSRGFDLSVHRSRRVEASDLREADVVVVMTAAQQAESTRLEPLASAKVWLLGERDIADPYMEDPATYEACAVEIEAGVEVIADRVASGRL